jgi:hypothetical protein
MLDACSALADAGLQFEKQDLGMEGQAFVPRAQVI